MLNSFLSSILLGLSLSIPIGPINIEMVKRGIKFGFFHSWVVGLGGMSADLVLMFAIFFGLSTFLTQSVMQFIMWLSGFLILYYLGYESIKEAYEPLPPLFHEEVGVSYHLHRRSFCAEEGDLLPLDECIGSLLDGSSKQHRHHTDGAVQPFYYFLLTQSVDTSASFVRSSV
jgi:hypothetical protein